MVSYLEINVKIEGIHCGGCLNRIEVKLLELGVDKFDLELSTRIAQILFDHETTSSEEILNEIKYLGYRPILQSTTE